MVLARLGVLDEVRRRAARVERLLGVTVAGRRVMGLEYHDLAPGLHGLGVTRGALFGALLTALQESGATVEAGREIRSMRDEQHGAFLTDTTGREEGPFELVVVCDGARSALRPVRAGARAGTDGTAYAWGAFWCVLADEKEEFAGVLGQVYEGTGKMVGFMPSGRPDGIGAATVSVFWSVRTAEFAAWRARPIDDLAAAMGAMQLGAKGILKQLLSWDQVVSAQYHDACARPSGSGRVVFLGDASHAMSLQLGQGANLALWDAWVLSQMVPEGGHARDDGGAAIAASVARFARDRAAHTEFYRRASRWLTPWFQSNHEGLAVLRDALLRPLSRVAWVRRQMLLSLAGVKMGVFGEVEGWK